MLLTSRGSATLTVETLLRVKEEENSLCLENKVADLGAWGNWNNAGYVYFLASFKANHSVWFTHETPRWTFRNFQTVPCRNGVVGMPSTSAYAKDITEVVDDGAQGTFTFPLL